MAGFRQNVNTSVKDNSQYLLQKKKAASTVGKSPSSSNQNVRHYTMPKRPKTLLECHPLKQGLTQARSGLDLTKSCTSS